MDDNTSIYRLLHYLIDDNSSSPTFDKEGRVGRGITIKFLKKHKIGIPIRKVFEYYDKTSLDAQNVTLFSGMCVKYVRNNKLNLIINKVDDDK